MNKVSRESSISKKIKTVVRKAAQMPGIYSAARKRKAGPIALFYHGVEDQISDPKVQLMHLSFQQFEKQIAYLRRHFDIISLDHFYDCISNGYKLDPSQIMITFDDGYKNNSSIVGPYLDAEDVPFAVFISTRHINEGLRFPTYYLRTSIRYSKHKRIKILQKEFDIGTQEEKQRAIATISKTIKNSPQRLVTKIVEELNDLIPRDEWLELNSRFSSDEPMNWDEVKQLHDRGVTIGSHCHDHFILHGKQCVGEMRDQLQTSKALIQEHVGKCSYIAYPNGSMDDISSEAIAIVRESQYLAGFTTVEGEIESGTNPYVLPRIGADISDMSHFEFIVNTSFRHNGDYRDWAKCLA